MSNALWKNLFGARDSPEDLQGPPSLSEEACGDLVHSLVRLGYLSNIATSLDAKSFITHDQLSKDIQFQLEKRHGRVSLLDLPKALNASLADIQDRVQDLIRSKPGKILQVQDELLKTDYLDNMTAQFNEELKQHGYLVTADLCRKHKFGIDFMRQFLKDRVGGVILGQWDIVDRGLVIAPAFLEKEKAALLKTLQDLEEPTSLQTLRARRVVQDQLFYGLCDVLSKEGVKELPGLFRGTNDQGSFVPRPYEQQQTDWIETFFRNNGFIELDLIKKRGVADPKAYLQANHPSALMLETHAVKEGIWSIVDASVEDTIANLSWIDVKPLLPTPLTKGDISSLLRQLPSLVDPANASRIIISPDQDPSLTGYGGGSPQETFVIQDSIVVTSGQLQKCLLEMGPLLDRSVKTLVSWRLSFGDNQQMDGQGDGYNDENNESYSLTERGSSLKGLMEHVLSGQDLPHSKKSGKQRNVQGGAGGQKGKKKQIQDFMTIQDVKQEIRRLEPDFDTALVNAVAGALYRDLVQNLKDRNRSVVLNQPQEEEEEQEQEEEDKMDEQMKESLAVTSIPSSIQSLSKRIQLSSRGIDVFEDVSAKNSLSKYLLQSWCIELLDLTVLHLASLNTTPSSTSEATQTRERLERSYTELHHRENRKDTVEGGQGAGPLVVATEDVAQLLTLIPQEMTEPLKKMRKLTAGSGKQKNLIEYLDICSNLLKDQNLGLETSSDAMIKGNSPVLVDHMEEMRQILHGIKDSMDAALTLHIVTLIAFQKWTGCILHASGKYVPRILRQLRLSLEKSALDPQIKSQLELLESMLGAVLSNVKHQQEPQEIKDEKQDMNHVWQPVYELGITLSSLPE